MEQTPQSQQVLIKRIRIGAIALAAVYIIAVVFLNTEDVETNLLFFRFSMSRALLLFVTLLIGFVAGFTANGILHHRRKR